MPLAAHPEIGQGLAGVGRASAEAEAETETGIGLGASVVAALAKQLKARVEIADALPGDRTTLVHIAEIPANQRF